MIVMSALALGGAPATSWSQSYPNRSIKMIVPFPPAGAADVTARIVAKAFLKILGSRSLLIIEAAQTARLQVQEGRVRALMTLLPSRSPLAPTAPTAQEVGINNMSINPWGGLYGPVGISTEVVNRVALAMKNVAARKDVREQLGTIAFELQSSTPAEMDQFNKDQLATWRKTADAINLERN